MENFVIKYKPKGVEIKKPFTTEFAATDEVAAREYFQHFYRNGEIVSIEKVLVGIKSITYLCTEQTP